MDNVPNNDDKLYLRWHALQQEIWEKACRRCGCCCGLGEQDPCEHLCVEQSGKTFCRIYDKRFGLHKTISGREFQCVPLRDIIHRDWPGAQKCVFHKCYFKKADDEKSSFELGAID